MTQYLLSVYMIDGQEPPSEEEITKMYADVDVVNEELKQTGAWVFARNRPIWSIPKMLDAVRKDLSTSK